jgi:penicillin-binding protein 2
MAIYQQNFKLLRRLGGLKVFAILVFVLFGFKLWHLTVVKFSYYSDLAERNQIRRIPLKAPRGLILDREGRVLVDNVNSFTLYLFRERSVDLERTVDFLLSGLKLESERLQETLEKRKDYPAFQPIAIAEDLSMDEIAFLLARQSEYPELRIYEQPMRRYRYDPLAAHTLGYVGEISKAELTSDEFAGLRAGTIVGKYGLERIYNRRLTGRDGYRQVYVNSLGRILEEIQRVEPTEGEELRLTIDLDLQRAAEEEMGTSPGAVVVMDPRSGAVLAMVSRPAFDPNLFASGISRQALSALLEDSDHPFQNRAIQGIFSPGSIFKVVMALAGLELGLIDENTSVYCSGAVNLYGRPFRCWKAGGHGRVRVHEAIQHSCNVYFYLLGQRMGIRHMAEFGRKIGLGRATGIDLPGEKEGLVPSEEWKRRVLGQPWYRGETISVSIGQGPINVTPIQLARAMSLICGGQVLHPHLVADPELNPSASERDPIGLQEEHLRLVRRGMWASVNDWGTGRGAKVDHFQVCGKTGTAQIIGRESREKLSDEAKDRFEHNAWFVGFAPEVDPEVVVTVIVQRGGSGGSAAAPIAGAILQEYYKKYRSIGLAGREYAADFER